MDTAVPPAKASKTKRWVIVGGAVLILAGAAFVFLRGSETVTIHGSLTSSGQWAGPFCGGSLTKAEQLTFRDGAGKVIGTTPIGEISAMTSPILASVCTETATYSIDLPREAFYEVQVAGVSSNPDPISYEDLQAQGFRYDLSIS